MTPPTTVPPASAGGLDLSLEQFDATGGIDANDCPNPRVPWMIGTNPTTAKAVVFRPRCKLWSCPVCGKSNAWAWSFRANAGAHALYDAGASVDFVCITSSAKLSPAQSWWVAPKAWMKLQARVRRKVHSWQYFAVPEIQPGTRRVHFHMLTTANLPERWWKDNAAECGFGYISDKEEVWSLGGVVSYVSKYLTKSLDEEMPPRTRRIRTSRGWPRDLKEPPEGWDFIMLPRDTPLERAVMALTADGYHVEIKGSKSAWRYVEQSFD